MNRIICVACMAGIALSGTVAKAVVFGGSAVGSWSNLQRDSNDYTLIQNNDAVAPNGVALFEWGQFYGFDGCYYGSSSMTFDGRGSDGATDPMWSSASDPFVLGSWNYHNAASLSSTVDGVRGIDLNVLISILTPGGVSVGTFTEDFGIVNTPNPCGDMLSLSMNPMARAFTYGGVNYTFSVLGLSRDGGLTWLTSLTEPEGCSTCAYMYGRIVPQSAPASVPEATSTVWLLGGVLMAVTSLRKKLMR
jgi:hypothetical protein